MLGPLMMPPFRGKFLFNVSAPEYISDIDIASAGIGQTEGSRYVLEFVVNRSTTAFTITPALL